MGAEVLLYGYGLVCLSMIVFNVCYGLHLRGGLRRLERRAKGLSRRVEGQLRRLRAGEAVEGRHLKDMDRRLARVGGLLAFDHLLDGLEGTELLDRYLGQMQPVFLYLAIVYRRREATQAAYYCSFLARHQLQRHMQMDQMQRVMLSYLERDSLYCRVNALKALCAFGRAETVVEALLHIQGLRGASLHAKVIVEALMAYTGDPRELIDLLWKRFGRFSDQAQRALLDYMRFQSGEDQERMLGLLRDGGLDKELRFAAIRYFGRYPYEPARPLLLAFAADTDPLRWEYAAIASSALAAYSGQDAIDALIQALRSTSWHVRYNAAASLEAHGLAYDELAGVLDGDDRYARDMLLYRLESRRRAEGQAAATPEREAVAAL